MKGNHKDRSYFRNHLSNTDYDAIITNAEYIEIKREQYIDDVIYVSNLVREV